MSRRIAFVLVLALAGCATPYQEMGLTGGVQATQVQADLFQVTARGNGYTDADAVQRYVLRRAAEQVIAAGFDLFQVVQAEDRTVAPQRYGLFSTIPAFPGQTLMVRGSKYPAPSPLLPGMYDARELVKYLAPLMDKQRPPRKAVAR